MSMRTFVLVFLGTINNYVKKLLNKSLLPVNCKVVCRGQIPLIKMEVKK